LQEIGCAGMSAPDPYCPPTFAVPNGRPGPLALWRSIRNPIYGWSKEVFEGGVYRAALPGAPLVVGDPALAAEILIERSEDFPHGELLNRLFTPIWGRGIFVAEGADWRWQRRAAAPAFRPTQMAMLAPVMRRAAEAILLRWRDGAPIDLQAEMRRLTLQILFDAMLSGGEDFPDRDEASRQVDAFIGRVGRIVPTDALPMPAAWRPSVEARGGRPAAYMRARVAAMIARRRRQSLQRGDLVDMLMAAEDSETGRKMDDELSRDNLMGFIAAGHETTAFALSWALWITAVHAPTRHRLLAEIKAVTQGGPVEGAHLDRLHFTRQVIQEAMRLYPAAVAITRAAMRDTELGGYSIRRGAPILVAIYALHRLADFWELPHAFDPDRFEPGSRAGRSPGLYLPFGAGPRSCMGASFATTELMVALATLVRGARLQPDAGRPPQIAIRLGGVVARNGLWATPEPTRGNLATNASPPAGSDSDGALKSSLS
jgi:cytochrome P450